MTILQAVSPLDDRVLGEFEITSPQVIDQQLMRAREAAHVWEQATVTQRLVALAPLRQRLLENADAIVECIHRTTGKVPTEALLGEIYPVLDLLAYYQRHAAAILAGQAVATSPFGFPGATACITRKPFGVVAVISPWNYPFQLAMAPLLTALIAGNAVLLKPSEFSLPVASVVVDLLQSLDLPAGLVQCVMGGRETGEQLIDAGPDFVFFTGGLQAGRAVMQRAAQHPLPVLLELGGKDAMLVFADANLQRACDAALYGAFSNSGQICVSIERLYVQQDCYEPFLQSLLAGVEQLNVGTGVNADLGAMTVASQIDLIQAHYDDALAQGAQASGPLVRDGNFLKPVVLWRVHHGMRVMQEESFGPLLPVMAFTDDADAVRLANDSAFGLNASVWSQNIARAERIAKQLRVGNWAVNDVIKNIGHPGLPFGGIGKSGFGRYHGAEGLRSFSYAVSGLTSRSPLPKEPNWFPYSPARHQAFKGFIDFVHGSGTLLQRTRRNWPALQAFRDYSVFDLTQRWHNFKLLFTRKRDD